MRYLFCISDFSQDEWVYAVEHFSDITKVDVQIEKNKNIYG